MSCSRLLWSCVVITTVLGCGARAGDSSGATSEREAWPSGPSFEELRNAKPVDPNSFVKIQGGPTDNGGQYTDRVTNGGDGGSSQPADPSQQIQSLLDQANRYCEAGLMSLDMAQQGPLPGQVPPEVGTAMEYMDDCAAHIAQIGQSYPVAASDAQTAYARVQALKMRLSSAVMRVTNKLMGGGKSLLGGG